MSPGPLGATVVQQSKRDIRGTSGLCLFRQAADSAIDDEPLGDGYFGAGNRQRHPEGQRVMVHR
jgi:hypothetical protein